VAMGKYALIFDDREILQLLRTAIEREGNQGAFAKRHDLERSHLNMVLNGKRPLSRVLRKLSGSGGSTPATKTGNDATSFPAPWTVQESGSSVFIAAANSPPRAACFACIAAFSLWLGLS
jgi:hypothetical protein